MNHTATYSPDDNKLRLYPACRLSKEDYELIKAAGFRWAPKQEIFVAPAWSPRREDVLLEHFVEEIGDEDYSHEERAADRAERFSGYRDKRRSEAHSHADTFETGPSVFGHQNLQRAERAAAKHDRHRGHALTQWRKAEYWQNRTAAVIGHALHKADPATRRGRILKLEAEQRKHEKSREEYAARHAAWLKVLTLDGPDVAPKMDGYYLANGGNPPAVKLAYALANTAGGDWHYKHPRTGRESSLQCHLSDAKDPITAREAAAIWLENKPDPEDEDSYSNRWARHYELRLTYERAMLENEGGSAAEVEIEPGGFITFGGRVWQLRGYTGQYLQIEKVSKSPATKKVTSVSVLWVSDSDHDRKGNAYGPDNPRPLVLHTLKIGRLGESAYRAPTEEERAAFAAKQQEAKQAKKAASKANPKPSLINPTDNDAERLQAHWNARAAEAQAARQKDYYGTLRDLQPSEVLRLTQAQYSERSKGAYAKFETVSVCIDGHRLRTQYGSPLSGQEVSFLVRKAHASSAGGGFNYGADRVIVITDKPQKPLPLDWEALIANPAEELASA